MKWIIEWDAGYGPDYEVIEVDSFDDAMEWAYENWSEAAESNADYKAHEYTDELAEDYGL